MLNKSISRRDAAKTLVGAAAVATVAANPVAAAVVNDAKPNVDADIFALTEKIQLQLQQRTEGNLAIGEARYYTDGQGYVRDYFAERDALDLKLRENVMTLRGLKPSSDEAMRARFIAFNNAYFTVWQTMEWSFV